MAKLYEINTDYLRIIEAVEEADGELTPELEQQLAANGEDFSAKVENYLKAIRNYEAEAAAFKEEADRFKAKKERAKKTADRLKESVLAAMQQRGISKQNFGNLTASVLKTERVVVDDDLIATLPDDFKRVNTTIEPDKTALKEALKAGEEVEGAQITLNYSLQIK